MIRCSRASGPTGWMAISSTPRRIASTALGTSPRWNARRSWPISSSLAFDPAKPPADHVRSRDGLLGDLREPARAEPVCGTRNTHRGNDFRSGIVDGCGDGVQPDLEFLGDPRPATVASCREFALEVVELDHGVGG